MSHSNDITWDRSSDEVCTRKRIESKKDLKCNKLRKIWVGSTCSWNYNLNPDQQI